MKKNNTKKSYCCVQLEQLKHKIKAIAPKSAVLYNVATVVFLFSIRVLKVIGKKKCTERLNAL